MNKKHGVLSKWDEIRGFGFVVARNPDGSRRSWFLHYSRISQIDEPSGIPEVGSFVHFDEEANPRGVLAINAEIKSLAPTVHKRAGLNALAGHEDGGAK